LTVSRRSPALSRAISTLLELNYPEFEVIVVADGASEIVIDTLDAIGSSSPEFF
jgi:glycosyltransferase involved in cell wall biosynthesis